MALTFFGRWRGLTMPENLHCASLDTASTLPMDIAESLSQVARRHRRLQISCALLKAILISLLISLMVVLLLGSSPMMPLALRWLIALAAWCGMIATTVRLLRPALSEVNLESAAGMVEKCEPEHEERIISAVEFSQSPPPVQHASPEMVRHVIKQAQEHTQRINVDTVLSPKNMIRWAAYCAPAVLAWLILWPLFPQTLTTGVRRIFAPWSAPVGSSISIHVTPGNVTLGEGAELEIIGQAKPPLGGKPIRSMTLDISNTAGMQRLIAMTHIGPDVFRAKLSDIAGTFRYQLQTGNAQSMWYTANVIARPRISELELRYTFPSYTALPPRNVTGKDGSIKAVVGTQMQLVVHASEPLSTKSFVAMGTPVAGVLQPLPLTRLTGLEYQATFPVQYSTSYRIDLLNKRGIKNSDNHLWPIIAIPDQPPVIHIIQPARRLRARADDIIPILFHASDAYGLSNVQAVVTVGHSLPMHYRIDLGTKNPRQVRQTWNLSVADQLTTADRPHANVLFYRLEAIDNCQPAHQKTRTALHELLIDRHLLKSYQQRRDMAAYQELKKTIAQAQNSIRLDQQRVSNLQHTPGNRRFSAYQRRMADQVQQNLAQSVDNLKAAAKAAQNSAFSSNASKAASVSEHTLPKAADQIAAASFANSHQAAQRNDNLAQAQSNLRQAQQKLGKLQRQMARQAGQQQLADSLKTLAQEQRTLAKKMARQPDSPAVKRQQQALHRQLTRLLQQHKSLQTPVAAKVQPTVASLKNKVEKIIAAQQQANGALQQQLRAQSARQQLTALASQQQKLNTQIQNLESSTKAVGRQQPDLPNNPVMNSVVSNLRQHAAQAALEGQNGISNGLRQAAEDLNKAAEPPTARQRQAHETAMANVQKLAKISQSANPATNATAAQQANALQHAAAAMNKLAQKMLNEAPTTAEATALNSAMTQAQAAMRAAADQNAGKANTFLQRAGQLMNQAVRQQLAATGSPTNNPGQLRQLAAQAAQLAQQQDQLAAQTRKLMGRKSAPPQNPAQEAQKARQIAREIKQATALAGELEKQTHAGAPDLNSDMAQARRQMQSGSREQLASAKALSRINNTAAQEHQQSALQHLQIAMDDLNGALHSPEMRNVPQYKDMIAGQIQRQKQQASTNSASSGKHAAGNQGENSRQQAQTGQSRYQRIMSAAQQVQNAMQAQQQAGQGNQQAAQQAAQSLGAAGQSMNTQGTPGGQGLSESGNGGGTQLAMGQRTGQAGAPGTPAAPGQGNSDNPTGSTGPGGPTGAPPKPVLAMGISPSQWSNLGPLARRQLLNTARQDIPSGYKRMVRDYYIRLSEMRAH